MVVTFVGQYLHRCEYYLVSEPIQWSVMTPFEFSMDVMLL
jgi:hypothetical protein